MPLPVLSLSILQTVLLGHIREHILCRQANTVDNKKCVSAALRFTLYLSGLQLLSLKIVSALTRKRRYWFFYMLNIY